MSVVSTGVYGDMPAEEYLADPVPDGSLSASGARKLLPPSCPARFQHWRTAGQPPKAEFDFGHCAHKLVLSEGPPIVIVEAKDWRGKVAREQRAAAYAAGHTPVLRGEYEQAQDMADALARHPIAAALFHPDSGQAEQSLFWVDAEFDIWRRARLDWLPKPRDDGRLIIPDYKTARSVEPAALSRALHDYGYGQQAAWYLDAVTALGLAGDIEPAFVLVAQEKEPPYLVTVGQPDQTALSWGRVLNRKAIDTYARCQAKDEWPGYADGAVVSLELPGWVVGRHEAAYERGDYDIEDVDR